MIQPVLRYPGAKASIAEWIVGHMPPHQSYLEPFAGSLAVLMAKPRSRVETVNDLDGRLCNFWRVLRDRPEELAAKLEFTPWSREEYYASRERADDPVEDARRYAVRLWMARASATCRHTGWRHDVRGSQDRNVARVWADLPIRVMEAAQRLRGVQIECRPALDVIRDYAAPGVLIYADPPYLLRTRSGRLYANEMTDEEHMILLDALDAHPGPVLLSGYDNPLYTERLGHWTRRAVRAVAEAGAVRTEVLWLNPVAARSIGGSLFD